MRVDKYRDHLQVRQSLPFERKLSSEGDAIDDA